MFYLAIARQKSDVDEAVPAETWAGWEVKAAAASATAKANAEGPAGFRALGFGGED